jgi:hypothetical protein
LLGVDDASASSAAQPALVVFKRFPRDRLPHGSSRRISRTGGSRLEFGTRLVTAIYTMTYGVATFAIVLPVAAACR